MHEYGPLWNEFKDLDGRFWPGFRRSIGAVISNNWMATVSKNEKGLAYSREDLFRYTVLQAAVNTEGGGVTWAAGPYPYGQGWENGVQEGMEQVGNWLKIQLPEETEPVTVIVLDIEKAGEKALPLNIHSTDRRIFYTGDWKYERWERCYGEDEAGVHKIKIVKMSGKILELWDSIKSYNVKYSVPGQTDRSAMPIGNGELCASVWMNESGYLRFYFGRTDTLTENDNTAKLGMLELHTEPGFLSKGGYEQTLILEDGYIEIKSNLGKMMVFVSVDSNTIYVSGEFSEKTTVYTNYVNWRKSDNPKAPSPWLEPVTVSKDIVEKEEQILFYHKNGENGIKALAEFEGVSDTTQVPDFLTDRIFGGKIGLWFGCFCRIGWFII